MSRTLALWGNLPIPFKNKKNKISNRGFRANFGRSSRVNSVHARRAVNLAGSRRILVMALLFGNIALAVVYFLGVNQNAAKGYEFKKVTFKINQLTEENKKLIVKISEVGSILEIQKSSSLAQFVPVDAAEFLEVKQLSQR